MNHKNLGHNFSTSALQAALIAPGQAAKMASRAGPAFSIPRHDRLEHDRLEQGFAARATYYDARTVPNSQ
jgi:hypothetical protein